jgi:DHA2 family multidrug resistance protein
MHQTALASHTNVSNPGYMQMLNGLKSMYLSQGFDAATAAQKALATIYGTMRAQAGALSFENAFWTMSAIIVCLVPLPFIMRRPKARPKEPIAVH